MLLYSSFTPACTSTLQRTRHIGLWRAQSLSHTHTHTHSQLVLLMSFSHRDCDEVINFYRSQTGSQTAPSPIRGRSFTIISLRHRDPQSFHWLSDIAHQIEKYFFKVASCYLIGWLYTTSKNKGRIFFYSVHLEIKSCLPVPSCKKFWKLRKPLFIIAVEYYWFLNLLTLLCK